MKEIINILPNIDVAKEELKKNREKLMSLPKEELVQSYIDISYAFFSLQELLEAKDKVIIALKQSQAIE